jgi:hypothetical protein
VNTDPLVSSKDQQTEVFLRDFIRPFPNISHLEVDYTMLEVDDPRIKERLEALPVSDHGDFDAQDPVTGSLGEEKSILGDSSDGRSSDKGSKDSSTDDFDAGDFSFSDFLTEEAYVDGVVAASTVMSLQLRVSAPRKRLDSEGPEHGFGSWTLKQHTLLFRQLKQLDMSSVCNVHITYDFENLTVSGGSILGNFLNDLGTQVWPQLKTLKVCITYKLDPIGSSYDWGETEAVSGRSVTFVRRS